MANPKRKHSRSRRDTRRSQWKLTAETLAKCSNCGALKIPHHVCPSCGFYNEKLVVAPKPEKTKEEEKGA